MHMMLMACVGYTWHLSVLLMTVHHDLFLLPNLALMVMVL